jgi:type II secretory ATPase GspE/PulE/Tfp pilus assembly ATPase PilB-like protein
LPTKAADMPSVPKILAIKPCHLPPITLILYLREKQPPRNASGYQGRMGLYEVFEVTEAYTRSNPQTLHKLRYPKSCPERGHGYYAPGRLLKSP